MKFFMVSKCGEGAGLLYRIQKEGHDCQICIKEPDYQSVYDGLLDKALYPHDKNTIIIFDSSGMGARADKLRDSGFKVFGASKFHDRLENDRKFGLSFMEDNGIMIPETKTFNDFSEGISFIEENSDKRYVFKPSGDLPSKLTYSCSDTEDLIHYMKYVEKYYGSQIEDFILQEFIEGSIISTEYWVGPKGFIKPLNHTIEVKKLMNDELGPSTGCSGNIVWLGDEDSILDQELKKVEQELVKNKYLGPIDLNAIVNDKGIYGLEWTPRFGLDAMPTLLQLIDEDLGEILIEALNGDLDEIPLNDDFAAGIRITIPPYPIELKDSRVIQKNAPNKNIPIRGFEDCERYCYFYEVMSKNDELYHSDGTGVIAIISDVDNDPKDVFDTPYEILENCKVPDKQYRTDLNKILPTMYKEVKEALCALV
jgi:phosphoribosylamine--glycine ligase